jgi:predicted TIM-barrel fold metal-dependent hydrolase
MTATARIDHPVVSADDHMDLNVMPPDLFVSRVPSAMRDRVPNVRDAADGPTWFVGDQSLALSGRRGKGYRATDERGFRPGRPHDRLADMDVDRVLTHVIYGPLGGLPAADAEAQRACIRAYNEWAVEFCSVDPNRLVVLAQLPSKTPDAAADELSRAIELGHRGAIVDPFVGEPRLFSPEWDRFWAIANDARIPISVHIGGGMHSVFFAPGVWRAPATATVIQMQLDEILVGLIFSGTLERHPDVRVVFGESGLGWVPYVLDRMDEQHRRFRDVIGGDALTMTPRELFDRQVFMTYEEDDVGLELLDRIGAGNVMWASDYPHGDSTWPRSLEAIAESPLARLDASDRRKIICDNAASLYRIDVKGTR